MKPRLTILLCFLAAMCEGIDLQTAGVAAAGIRQEFHPDNQMLSYFFSAGTLGLFIGAIVGGCLADRIGRKSILVVSILVFGLFSLITPLAWNIETLTWARFLTGFGLGGALPNLVSIGSENAPPARRNVYVTMIYSGTPLGGAIASFASLLTPAAHWSWIFIVGGIVPLIVAPMIGVWLEESQRFHRLKSDSSGAGDGAPGLLAFLADGRGARTLLLWVSFFLALLTLYLLLNWLPSLLAASGVGKSQVGIAMIGFNSGGFLAARFIGTHLETQMRHRGVLLAFIGTPLLLLLAQATGQRWAVALLIAVLGAAVLASQAVLYAYAPLCYPTRVRGTGMGFAVAMGRIGSIAGPLLGGSLVSSGRTPSQVLTGLLPIVCLGSVCAIALAWRQPPAPPIIRGRIDNVVILGPTNRDSRCGSIDAPLHVQPRRAKFTGHIVDGLLRPARTGQASHERSPASRLA
jgi:AAHS family 3-hydroxyphenylpropionic acid transporter